MIRSLALILVALALAAPAGARAGFEPPPSASPDERIAFYKPRAKGPGTYPIHARLGLAYLDRGRETRRASDIDAAERHLRTSLEAQVNYEALVGLAAVEAWRHRFPEARALAEEAVRAVPGDVEARGLLVEIDLALGDVDAAAAVVDEMLARGPTFAGLTRQALVREHRGDLLGALGAVRDACATAGEMSPGKRAWCEVRRGSLLLRAHCDVEGAEAAYRSAIELEPGGTFAREHLAELLATTGRTDEARRVYEALLDGAEDPHWQLALAELDETAGDAKRARRLRARAGSALRRSLDRGSGHTSELVLSLLDVGTPEAIARAVELAEVDRRPEALGWAYWRAGRPEDADRVFREAPGFELRAAVVARALGRTDEADRLAATALTCPAAIEPPAWSAVREWKRSE